MQPDAAVLLDIVIAARRARQFAAGLDQAGFERDVKTQAAVLYELTVIGEAVRRLPEAFTSLHPELPWREIAGMRNRLIHEYHRVELAKVWRVVQDDLPTLQSWLEPLIPPDPPQRETGGHKP
ncbi:MAG: DUF86 domain-containing protein [Planctomycetota bacterium]|nr:DUF86 domain-containing protein [Planctomycetota bacterium]